MRRSGQDATCQGSDRGTELLHGFHGWQQETRSAPSEGRNEADPCTHHQTPSMEQGVNFYPNHGLQRLTAKI